MATKVIGTGAPRMLTVRFRPCEVGVVLDELHHQRAVVTDAAAHAHDRSDARGAGAGDPEVEDHHDQLFLMARLLDDLRAHAPVDRLREVMAPTSLLGPLIRGAAVEAVERLCDAVRRFAADTGAVPPEDLRHAVDTAAALTGTLIGLDHAEPADEDERQRHEQRDAGPEAADQDEPGPGSDLRELFADRVPRAVGPAAFGVLVSVRYLVGGDAQRRHASLACDHLGEAQGARLAVVVVAEDPGASSRRTSWSLCASSSARATSAPVAPA
jgi:hypothetical protein